MPSSVVLPLGAPVEVLSYPFPMLVPTLSSSQGSLSSNGGAGFTEELLTATPSSPPVMVPLLAGSVPDGPILPIASPSWADVLRGPLSTALACRSRRTFASSTPSSPAAVTRV